MGSETSVACARTTVVWAQSGLPESALSACTPANETVMTRPPKTAAKRCPGARQRTCPDLASSAYSVSSTGSGIFGVAVGMIPVGGYGVGTRVGLNVGVAYGVRLVVGVAYGRGVGVD